jgi:hypothetical protein
MLGPLVNDLRVFVDRPQATVSAPPVAMPRVADLVGIRGFKAADVLAVIGDIQRQIAVELGKQGSPNQQVLADLNTRLNRLAQALSQLSQTLDAAIAPLKQRLVTVESWYDTVMAGFEERYHRSMRTWALVLGFVVVVLFNANFFKVVRTISESDIIRNRIVNYGAELTKAKSDASSAQSQLETSQRELDSAVRAGQPDPAQLKSLTDRRDQDAKRVNDLKQTTGSLESDLKSNVDAYSSFGFQRLQWAEVRAWVSDWSSSELPAKLKRTGIGLLGWLVTTLLVSIGAPFWQDVLESIFGVKNLLRQKGKKPKNQGGLSASEA